MENTASRIIFQDDSRYYPLLEVSLKSFVDYSPLPNIIASREKGKKIKPWVPQEENSVYIGVPKNAVFVTNSKKIKVDLVPGENQIRLPERSLDSNILEPYVSWHGKEGTLSVKGLKDKTLTKQTSSEYFEDIVPSVKRDDMAGAAVCILEVILPVHTQSFGEINNYPPTPKTKSIVPKKVESVVNNEPYLIEHPTDIILTGPTFSGELISVLFFVHIGTKLAPWTLDRVIDDLICEPITITNNGYKGAVNCTLLLRSLGPLESNERHPLTFSVKSSDMKQQIFFETMKYGT